MFFCVGLSLFGGFITRSTNPSIVHADTDTFDVTITIIGASINKVRTHENDTLSSGITIKTFPKNQDVMLEFIPDTGYQVSSVLVNSTEFSGADLLDDMKTGFTFYSLISNQSITITFTQKSYPVYSSILSGIEYGSVFEKTNVSHGLSHEVTFYPKAGCRLDTVRIDGITLDGDILANVIATNSYIIPVVEKTIHVEVTFVPETYEINVLKNSTDDNNAIHDSSNTPITRLINITHGTEITLFFTFGENSFVSDIKENGISINSTDIANASKTKKYKFSAISNLTITVTFAVKSYSLTVETTSDEYDKVTTTSGGTSITTLNVQHGETTTLFFEAGTNRHLQEVTINGITVSDDELTEVTTQIKKYSFFITSNIHVHATFAWNVYAIEITTVDDKGTNTVIEYVSNENRDITIQLTREGYVVTSILVDNLPIYGDVLTTAIENGSYTIQNVQNPHSIVVVYEENATQTPQTCPDCNKPLADCICELPNNSFWDSIWFWILGGGILGIAAGLIVFFAQKRRHL